MTMSTNIEKREARLLRWEGYLRRTRHVAFWLGVMMIGLPLALSAWEAPPPEDTPAATFWTAIFFFAWAYQTHLKVRHIESIKFHRQSATTRSDEH